MSKFEPSREDTVVWVRRDKSGKLLSVSLIATPEHPEKLASDAAEMLVFARALAPRNSELIDSDLSLVRVIEDLVDVLIRKDLLRLTDLPDSVQAKLLKRRKLRGSLRSLSLLGDDSDDL